MNARPSFRHQLRVAWISTHPDRRLALALLLLLTAACLAFAAFAAVGHFAVPHGRLPGTSLAGFSTGTVVYTLSLVVFWREFLR